MSDTNDSGENPDTDPSGIEFTEQHAKDIARILRILTSERERTSQPRERKLVDRAAEIIAHRTNRTEHFDASMFGEPAWDMLLALYVNEASGARFNVKRLTASSHAPPTTAIRWIDYLEHQQLVRRESQALDARMSLIVLTDKAIRQLELYLSQTLE